VNVAETFFRGSGILILIGGLFSTMSALNATIYSSSSVSFAMGRDRTTAGVRAAAGTGGPYQHSGDHGL
jgi:amino acid transporter